MKLSKSKIGQMAEVGGIILILSGAIVMFLLITKVSGDTEFERAINTCKSSVILQTVTEAKPDLETGWSSPLDLNCERRYVNFFNTRVDLGLSPETAKPMEILYNYKKIKKFKSLNDDIVNQVVAEEMRICWFQFSEGKRDVWPNQEKWFAKEDDICFRCSEITFEDSVEKEKFGYFYQYIDKTVLLNYGTSYLKYFDSSTKSEKSWTEYNLYLKDKNLFNNIDVEFEKNKKYVVLFYKDYDASPGDDSNYQVMVVPDTELNKMCDQEAS